MQLELSIVIQRSAADVFTYVTNIEAQARWQRATVENKPLTAGPVEVGTKMRHFGKFLGTRIETVAEVVEYEPTSRYRYRSIQGYLPVDMQYLLEPTGGGTKLTLIARGEPGRYFKVGGSLFRSAARWLIAGDLRRLKRVLEEQVN